MSELTKQQLAVENNTSFPNNNTGFITPTLLRTFNGNIIDSMVDEVTYNADSASWTSDIIALEAFSSSLTANFVTPTQLSASSSTLQNNINTKLNTASFNAYTASQGAVSTGSLLLTASAAGNVITFTKGDGSTFPVTVATGSVINTGSFVTTSSFNSYTASASTNTSASINAATSSLSASLTLTDNSKLNTASFNTYTASAATNVSASINAATSSLSASIAVTDLAQSSSIAQLLGFSSSLDTTFATDTQLSASASTLQNDINTRVLTSSFNSYTASAATGVSASINSATGSSLITASISGDTITFTKGNGSTFPIVVPTGSGGAGDRNGLITTGSSAVTQSITGSVIVSGAANFTGGDFKVTDQGRNGEFDVDAFKVKTQSSAQFTGSLLVSGGFNAKVAFPALNVTNNILQSTGSIIVSQDIVRSGGGANDVASLRLQARTGSAGAGDALVSTITAQNNLNTASFLSASAVASLQVTFSTGSAGGTVGYTAGLTATAQSGSAISVLSGNTIRLGTSAANVITSTGSFGAMVLVAPLNTPALSIRSGSFELTTPQGSGSFYSNCPITSSGLRINGTALVADLIVSGVFGGNSSLQVTANASVTESLYVGGQLDVNSIGGARGLSITGSNPTITNGSLSGSLVSTIGDTYPSTPQGNFIVTLDSASMATLLSGAGTNANTIYFVI